MPKKLFTIKDFSGGINSVQDPRDIDTKEFAYLKNFYVDQLGALRPTGSLVSHNGLVSNKSISSMSGTIIKSSGGRNLFYFESDVDASTSSGVSGATVEFHTGGATETSGGVTGPSFTAPPDESGL
jgi:hypothetical protein